MVQGLGFRVEGLGCRHRQAPVVREDHPHLHRKVDVRELKLPWREAGPPSHHDDKVDSDQ